MDPFYYPQMEFRLKVMNQTKYVLRNPAIHQKQLLFKCCDLDLGTDSF